MLTEYVPMFAYTEKLECRALVQQSRLVQEVGAAERKSRFGNACPLFRLEYWLVEMLLHVTERLSPDYVIGKIIENIPGSENLTSTAAVHKIRSVCHQAGVPAGCAKIHGLLLSTKSLVPLVIS